MTDGSVIDWSTIFDEAHVDTLRARAGHLVLTDDFAPVENLLAPVVRMRATGGLKAR